MPADSLLMLPRRASWLAGCLRRCLMWRHCLAPPVSPPPPTAARPRVVASAPAAACRQLHMPRMLEHCQHSLLSNINIHLSGAL